MAKKTKKDKLKTRKLRVRNKISGTSQRPRLSVYKSNANIYAQLVDDTKGVTLLAVNSLQADVKDGKELSANIETAKKIGEILAKKAVEKGIKNIVFDRSGYLYHGKVKALAESLRENGLEF